MKKYVFLVLVAFVAFAFTACDKSKDKNNPDDPTTSGEISENGVKNEFGNGRLIIGRWKQSPNGNYFTFASNGDAFFEGSYYSFLSGSWSYNAETRLLATTLLSWSFYMNIITTNEMQGITTGKGSSYGFSRSGNYVDANPKLIIGRWKNNNNNIEYTFDGKNYAVNSVKKGKYSITIEDSYNNSNHKGSIYFDNEEYDLIDLQGGYISFAKKGSDKVESFYYVTE